jgi:acetylornithine deacetylase/succinyl-diaminopimelate desuccinylase-like protein
MTRLPLLILLLSSTALADPAAEARAILDEIVAIDTTNPPGNELLAARAVAKRLTDAGLKPELVEFAPGRGNVVARLRGDGSKKPLLLLAHLDVVGAANQPWTVPPMRVTEKGGWLYGRGVLDDKGWAAVATALFLQLARDHAPLKRDVILALTGDEESGGLGVRFLLEHKKELIGDAEIALNEGGGLKLDANGKIATVSFQAAEKTYQSYELTARGMGGHSSVPNDENAIYRLARALDKLSSLKFPPRLTPTVREWLRAAATNQPEPRASAMRVVAASKDDPPFDAMAVLDAYPITRAAIRTTCVATMLGGGTRENALPVEARATVNCRVMPVDKLADVERALKELDPRISIKPIEEMGWGPEISVDGVVPSAIRKVARAQFGDGVVVSANVGTGATDSRFLRRAGILSYGVGVLPKPEELIRTPHGPDEGVPSSSVATGVGWLRALVHELAQ